MAIRCEFIDIIIPIETINRVYKGGYNQFIIDKGGLLACEWDDGILYRTGSMGTDVDYRLEMWEKLGLIGWNGQKWMDYCISESRFGGVEPNSCDWLITYKDIAYSKPYREPEKPREFPTWQGDIQFLTENIWINFHHYLSENNLEKAMEEIYVIDEITGERYLEIPEKEIPSHNFNKKSNKFFRFIEKFRKAKNI